MGVRARRLPSGWYIGDQSDLEISHDHDLLLNSSCGRSSVSASTGTEAVSTRRPRTSRSCANRLILTIGMFAIVGGQLIAAHAFSRVDVENHMARSRRLRHPLECKRSSDIIQTSAKESEASPLPPRRNWRICTKLIVEAAAKSTCTDGAITSPFDQTAAENGDNPQDAVAALETSTWSPEAYQSALELYDRFMDYCNAYDDNDDDSDEHLPQLILSALDILHQAYRLYGPESVVGSYNGGKDACVILHLMRAAYANYIRDQPTLAGSACQPKVIYFEHEDEFPEVLDLLHESVVEYDLNMLAFEKGINYPDGLRSIVETNFVGASKNNADAGIDTRRPFPIAFVLGTRAGDPNAGEQGAFAPSSSFMPPFMRVNPILTPEWNYSHVWHFLRRFDLKYCRLYDEGYTSLGTVKDTVPCPALKKDDLDLSWEEDTGTALHDGDDCDGEYWPAYMLKDWDQERAGRIKKEN